MANKAQFQGSKRRGRKVRRFKRELRRIVRLAAGITSVYQLDVILRDVADDEMRQAVRKLLLPMLPPDARNTA